MTRMTIFSISENNYIMIEETIQDKELTLTTYAHNVGQSRYKKQIITDVIGENVYYMVQ